MKKFLTMAAAAVMAVCLFALSACGGASGTLSSFVSAVKKGDFETAAEYVVGGSLTSSYLSDLNSDDELYNYMYDQTVGSFKYSVEETSTNDDETACTLSISYSGYSYTELVEWYGANALGNAIGSIFTSTEDITKSDIKAQLKEMEKKEGTTTVALVNEDGEWLLEAVTASTLLTKMFTLI